MADTYATRLPKGTTAAVDASPTFAYGVAGLSVMHCRKNTERGIFHTRLHTHQVAELFELRDDDERAIGVGNDHHLRAYPVEHLKNGGGTSSSGRAAAAAGVCVGWERER